MRDNATRDIEDLEEALVSLFKRELNRSDTHRGTLNVGRAGAQNKTNSNSTYATKF